MTLLPKMDYAAAQYLFVVQQQDHKKKVGLLAEMVPLRLGRWRPKGQCMAGNDPAARGRRAHPCLADDRASQTEMLATVVAVAAAAAGVMAVAHAAATVTGSQLEAVEGTSL